MKTFKQKTKYVIAITFMGFIRNISMVQAKDMPKFNNQEAQSAASGILTPITDFTFWAIPIVSVITIIATGLAWLAKDEDEKEQKPYFKTFKRIIKVALILESGPTILRIFGIS